MMGVNPGDDRCVGGLHADHQAAQVLDAPDGLCPAVERERARTTYVSSDNLRIAPHYALTRHSMAPGVVVVSKIVWDQLPQTDRAIIRAAAKESVARMRASFDASEQTERHQAGVEVIDDVDRNSFATALTPLYPTMISDPKLHDMVKRIQADDEVARQR
jgi:TRAP-type C4-dicarboxylate transport system substrate-binding protein